MKRGTMETRMMDEVPTTDITALLEKWYQRVPKIDEGIVTVENLVDALYCALDPGLTAPVEIQRLALEQLDSLAVKFCGERDGIYRIFDSESFYWTGKWVESERVSYHIRTWTPKEDASRVN